MTQLSHAESRGSAWQGLYRLGGVAALIAVVVFRRNLGSELVGFRGFGLFDVPSAHPVSASDWFALLQKDRLVGLALLNVFDMVNYALVGLIFIALYGALRRAHRSAMRVAMALGLVGIALALASNRAFSMLSLSNRYAAASSDAQRAMLLAAGEALLAINHPGAIYPGAGPTMGLLLVILAGLIISLVMLRSQVFGKAAAYVGILANGLALGYFVSLALAPELYALFPIISAPFRVLWYVLIAIRLFRLARVNMSEVETQLRYGNWVRKKNLLILGLCTLGVGALIFVPLGSLYRLMVVILFMITLTSLLFPLYAYIMFSPRGGGFQDKVYTLIIQSLGPEVNGNLLDIGSGNGVLAVKLAQQHPELEVVGIDYWGKEWEYSKRVCETNAQVVGVESRVHFQKGDAAALDFADNTFDGVVSNLTFHEVKSVADKREVVREALRVVKPEGAFAFVDYFYEKRYYGSASAFESYLRSLNLSQFEFKPLQHVTAIPVLLRHPRIFGKAGIVYGRK